MNIKEYIKERGFDENYILVNNFNSRISIGNILQGFSNYLTEKQSENVVLDGVVKSDFICGKERKGEEKCNEQCTWCEGYN